MAVDWGVESLRLSLFSTDAVPISDRDWEAITKEREAETRQAIPGGKRYVGKFADGQFTLATGGQRIDLVLSYLAVEPSNTQELPIIGPWDKVRETFVQITDGWLGTVPFPIIRIAFGGVLLCQTRSRLETYQALKPLLKSVNVDPEAMRDLQFRINWPGTSTAVNGLTLNRLTIWAAIQGNVSVIQMTGATVAIATGISELNALRLEIDHSTDHEQKAPFEHKDLIPIYQELVATACENASKGERP